VILSGTVSSRFAKRHVEDIAERVSGVRHVQNIVRVNEAVSSGDRLVGAFAETARATAEGTKTGHDR
jgi:hypothetical protein